MFKDYIDFNIIYSNNKIKDIIIESLEDLGKEVKISENRLLKNDIGFFSIDEFNFTYSQELKNIIFTDDLVSVSEYIFTFKDYREALRDNVNIFIFFIGKQNSLLDALSYSCIRNNVIYLEPSDARFRKNIKWILLLCSLGSECMFNRESLDLFICKLFIRYSGVNVLNQIIVSNEQDFLRNAFDETYEDFDEEKTDKELEEGNLIILIRDFNDILNSDFDDRLVDILCKYPSYLDSCIEYYHFWGPFNTPYTMLKKYQLIRIETSSYKKNK